MTNRILITGANGFIGRYCIEAFSTAGWETIACMRSPGTLPWATETVDCDLLDHDRTQKVVTDVGATHLLHLAWLSDASARWTSAANLDWVSATLNLARAFAAQTGKHFLFAGSCAEYEWQSSPLRVGITPLKPATLYGEAKARTGQLLRAAQSELGIAIAHARLFFCYGHGEPVGRLLPDLIAHLEAGTPFKCSDGLQRRDYLYAADIAQAFVTIAEAQASGEFNIGSGQSIAVRDLVQTTADQLAQPGLPQFGAIPQRPGDPEEIEADIAPLQALGFSPRFDLMAGIKDTLARREAAL
nr:NAD(P)-dependent oxidoreductase [Hyphomonas sp. Mor2]